MLRREKGISEVMDREMLADVEALLAEIDAQKYLLKLASEHRDELERELAELRARIKENQTLWLFRHGYGLQITCLSIGQPEKRSSGEFQITDSTLWLPMSDSSIVEPGELRRCHLILDGIDPESKEAEAQCE